MTSSQGLGTTFQAAARRQLHNNIRPPTGPRKKCSHPQESDAQIENLRLAFESMDTNGTGKVNSDVRGNACGWCRYVLCSVHKFVIQFVLLCRYERLTHTCQADL
eukprot:2944923-Rhodomonas_salina.2